MKQQQGAALVVVLSMLTMSLMLGLSGMQSSLIDERLAGNYKAATEAQMRAEEAASEIYEKVILGDKVVFENFSSDDLDEYFGWKEFFGFANDAENASSCTSVGGKAACYVNISSVFFGKDVGRYIFAMGAVFDGLGSEVVAESVPVFIKLAFGGGLPHVPATHSCYGESCSHQAGGNSELTGEDYLLPDDPECNGNACFSEVSPEPENKDACYYPDVESYSGCRTEKYDDDEGRPGWEAFVAGLTFDQSFEDGDSVSSIGGRNSPAIIEIKNGDVSRGTGNVNTIGVVVVRSGATFDMSGTGHHEGLIIVEDGGRLEYNGTPVLYGAIVTLEGREANDLQGIDKDDGYDLDISGNTNIRYSKEALDMIANSPQLSNDKPSGIESWN
ncbi:hypothetical protein HOP52_17195 [Halomonas campisalis]|uniref:Type 4 fimbrial biogenesis protein PilX N-terminal domain-containing protein n=1 Tax=Billgrantia campisalis TaxID=74661 RepID=A0ABS9PCK2_9GAMM|nr:PilX N-terminal domain-containing pilus assembly protein [Halomonas campisalis]MCG6659491.1 hypothetical protein [Halomonas campisalis]MDR5864304.1 hypothetical protein [Halomonas campisalis]